jgi:hypothetical protein
MGTKKAGDTQGGTWVFKAEERPGHSAPAPRLKLVTFIATFSPLNSGEVAEWLKALVSKTSIGVSLSRVRIPPSPQNFRMPCVSDSLPISRLAACPDRGDIRGNNATESEKVSLGAYRSMSNFFVCKKLPACIL